MTLISHPAHPRSQKPIGWAHSLHSPTGRRKEVIANFYIKLENESTKEENGLTLLVFQTLGLWGRQRWRTSMVSRTKVSCWSRKQAKKDRRETSTSSISGTKFKPRHICGIIRGGLSTPFSWKETAGCRGRAGGLVKQGAFDQVLLGPLLERGANIYNQTQSFSPKRGAKLVSHICLQNRNVPLSKFL